MYAHQVIEDLTRQLNITKNPIYKDETKFIPDYLKRSIKFHLGDIEDLNKISPLTFEITSPNKVVFKDGIPYGVFKISSSFRGLKLPYPVCWVEYVANKSLPIKSGAAKFGILAMSIEPDFMQCYFFEYIGNIWSLNFFNNVINLNNDNSEVLVDLNIRKEKQLDIPKIVIEQNVLASMFPLPTIHMFLKLLSCKNISTEIIRAPEKLNKKRERKGKLPIFDYHVLNVIVPSKKVSTQGGNPEPPISQNRVHLCRGHFKEFTEEHPLFGKYVGRYWWQPQVRGQNKKGIILKDYNIEHRELLG